MLFNAKVIDRMGKVENGSTVSDYDPEEAKRQISISASLAPLDWKDHRVNIIDVPGYFDFVGEMAAALQVVDAAVILVNAVSGSGRRNGKSLGVLPQAESRTHLLRQ